MRRRFSALFIGCFSIACLAYTLPGSGLFDSGVVLKVYERGLNGSPDRLIGFTPEHLKKGLKIPMGHSWFVRPMGAFHEAQWRRLASDITRQSVTGLDLSERWDVEDQTLAWLGTLSPVRWLQLHRTRITDQGMAQVSALVHLEVLSVSPKTSDTGLSALAPLRHLHELDLRGSRVSEAALSNLTVFPELRVLILNQNATDAAGPALARLASLREIDINGTQMGDDGIAAMSALALETFYASPRVTDAGLATVGHWTHLRRLDLSRTQITDAGLSSLAGLKALEELALTETAVTDAALVPLSEMRALKTLELSGTQITEGGLEFLARLPHLETLSLSWPSLTPTGTAMLAKFPHLKLLILNGTPVPETLLAGLHRKAEPVIAPAPIPLANKPVAFVTSTMAAADKAAAAAVTPPHATLMNLKMRPNVFQGLSGLRKIQHIETQTSELSDVITANEKQVAPQPAERAPRDFLGDIVVGVKR